jgi:ribosomal protein S18 acetylase RimI-like enzyme
MDPVTIRRAEPDDLDVLVPLFEGYRAFYKGEPDPESSRAFLSERLKRGESVVFLAIEESSNTGVGFVQLYPVFSSLHMRRAWILNDLFVEPEHRGHHIAKRLMDEARALAVETGATTISLETAPDNQAARQLYESLGFRLQKSFLHYVLEVEP